MRRIDRILFSALQQGDQKTDNQTTVLSDRSDLKEISAAKTPVPANDYVKSSDDKFQDNSNLLGSPATPPVITINKIEGSDKESTATPVYSPLTPIVITQKAISETSIESPAAPPFSPLTPLVTRKEANNISPIPPMSPSTLELFETLNQDFSSVEHEYIDSPKTHHSFSNPKQIGDYDNDTDSDYVPDSGEETDDSHSSVQQRKRNSIIVPESNSSEDETIQEGLIQTHFVMVHGNQTRTDRTAQMHHNESSHIVTNTIDDDITVDELISMCRGSDTEAIHPEVESMPPVSESNDVLQAMGRPKRGRKRKHPDYNLSEKKNRKYMNLPYHVKDQLVNSKIFYNYSCTCKQRCFLLVPTEKRRLEFDKFVTLGTYEAQLLFILNNVTESEKARSYTSTKTKTGTKKPRQFRRNYYICGQVVCKQMFLKTFQISSKRVDICLAKKRAGKTYKDKRGKKQGGWNKTPEVDLDFVKNIINSLPKYESHYRREKNNGTQYLKLGMTLQKIHEIYVTEFKKVYGNDKKYVSLATLKRIFYTYFNLRCKTLKKDTCKKCDALALEIEKCQVPEEKELLIKKRNDHQRSAEDRRNDMSQDLARAKRDAQFECITYDLEKTLPLPRIPTNIVFYKRQLWVYNAGIHVGSNNQGRCNVWVEGEAGRGAQEVGSCLVNFIKNDLREGVENLVLWSDSCGGQNRNIKIVLMLKTILHSHPNLRTITFKYLESGHSFLPNDTDFSKIECELKHHQRIYTVEEYINVMKISQKKNPFQVIRMKTQDFISTKNIEKKIVNRKICTNKNKINWLKTKQILLEKENQFITMTSESGCSQKLDCSKKIKGVLVQFSEDDFKVLWPQGKAIPQAKLEDLRSMFNLIPEDCHAFYNNLKGNININEDVDGFGPVLDFDLEEE